MDGTLNSPRLYKWHLVARITLPKELRWDTYLLLNAICEDHFSLLTMDSIKSSVCTFTRGDFMGYVSVKILRGVREFEGLDLELSKFLQERFYPLLDRANPLPKDNPLPEDLDTDNTIIHAVSAGGLSIVELYSNTWPEPSNFRQLEQLTRSFAYSVCRKSDKMVQAIAESLMC